MDVRAFIEVLTISVSIASMGMSILVGYSVYKKNREEPHTQKWIELKKWRDSIEGKIKEMDDDIHEQSHKIEDLEKNYSTNKEFVSLTLKSLKCILGHINTKDDKKISDVDAEINSYLYKLV